MECDGNFNLVVNIFLIMYIFLTDPPTTSTDSSVKGEPDAGTYLNW